MLRNLTRIENDIHQLSLRWATYAACVIYSDWDEWGTRATSLRAISFLYIVPLKNYEDSFFIDEGKTLQVLNSGQRG